MFLHSNSPGKLLLAVVLTDTFVDLLTTLPSFHSLDLQVGSQVCGQPSSGIWSFFMVKLQRSSLKSFAQLRKTLSWVENEKTGQFPQFLIQHSS